MDFASIFLGQKYLGVSSVNLSRLDIHNINDQYNHEGIAQSKFEESRAGRASTKSQNIEVCRKPDKEHLIEALVSSILHRRW
jgi:hypothetical protein